MAKYRCRQCQSTEAVPRPYSFHFGKRCRCHRCGTFRISKLKTRDRIDPMEPGFLNLLERWAGGQLYHCKFCRIQFWDRRRFVPAPATAEMAAKTDPAPTKPADTAPKTVESEGQAAAAKKG
jgi:hypothetical protein